MATKDAPKKEPEALTREQEDEIINAYLRSGEIPDGVESISLTRSPRVVMKA